MNTKEAYKQAYGQWRLLSKQRESMPEKARAPIYTQQWKMLNMAYGWKAADRAIRSFEDRDKTTYEGGDRQQSRRFWWVRDRAMVPHWMCRAPKTGLLKVKWAA